MLPLISLAEMQGMHCTICTFLLLSTEHTSAKGQAACPSERDEIARGAKLSLRFFSELWIEKSSTKKSVRYSRGTNSQHVVNYMKSMVTTA